LPSLWFSVSRTPIGKPHRANTVSVWYLWHPAPVLRNLMWFTVRICMTGRIVPQFVFPVILVLCILTSAAVWAQDVPGIEICTVEKTMERRTSCLQSNVDFLQKTITRLATDHQQKLDAANRQIEGLKSTVVALQKTVDDLQAAQKKAAEDAKKKTDAAAPAKDALPAK
jgi:hypothetical protein